MAIGQYFEGMKDSNQFQKCYWMKITSNVDFYAKYSGEIWVGSWKFTGIWIRTGKYSMFIKDIR